LLSHLPLLPLSLNIFSTPRRKGRKEFLFTRIFRIFRISFYPLFFSPSTPDPSRQSLFSAERLWVHDDLFLFILKILSILVDISG
jgi:hypothetical protein